MTDERKLQSSSERERGRENGAPGVLLREGGEHAEVSEVLYVVVGCSLAGISGHG